MIIIDIDLLVPLIDSFSIIFNGFNYFLFTADSFKSGVRKSSFTLTLVASFSISASTAFLTALLTDPLLKATVIWAEISSPPSHSTNR